MDHDHTRPSEVTLSTSTLLGIFFALVLVCAVFFGFGYSMGRHSMQSAATNTAAAAEDVNFNGFKPSPGSPAAQAANKNAISDSRTASSDSRSASSDSRSASSDSRSASTTRTAASSGADPSSDRTSSPAPATNAVSAASNTNHASVAAGNGAGQPSPARAAAPPASQPTAVAAESGTSNSASAMVQVAAVSHQEDADVLVRALKKRGHDVIARQDPADKLIHVQLGPFASRKDAEAMRQTLLTEGYNAIVK